MIALSAGEWHATLLPERGAAFRTLTHAGREVLAAVPDGADPNDGFHGAFVMAPWTNRLDGGRFVVGGVGHRMPVNRPQDGTAIHGLLRDLAWRVEDASGSAATLSVALDHPPFRCAARLRVALDDAGLSLSLDLANTGGAATPLGIGWHPWFRRPAGMRLRVATRTVFGRDARTLPTAARPCAGLNGADAVLDGLDTHFAGWDGVAEIGWPDGFGIVMRCDGAWATNLQVFAPRGGGVLCVEPVSHAPDAPNRAAAAAHGAMHVVPPGSALRGSLMIHRS